MVLKDVLRRVVFMLVGLVIIGGMTSCTLSHSSTTERHVINLTESMTVTAADGSRHHSFISPKARRFRLKAGDELIVTKLPSKSVVSARGRAITFICGWLPDGIKVDIPYIDLQRQSGWRSWKK